MSERFPGYLYAKSARIVEPAGSSYKEWFSHPALKSFEKRIEAFRNGFQWVSDSLKRHGPVVVAEAAGDGIHALVVRFIDAGKDAYGRSQTLRMEVFLVPTDTAFDFIDGSFSAVSHRNIHHFQIRKMLFGLFPQDIANLLGT